MGSSSPEIITSADLDGNGADDLVIDYGTGGLWKYLDNLTWSRKGYSNTDYTSLISTTSYDPTGTLMIEKVLEEPNADWEKVFVYEYYEGTDRLQYADSYAEEAKTTHKYKYEYYDSALNNIKRVSEQESPLTVYEYLDENWNDSGHGRPMLVSYQIMGEYKTYVWTDTQVVVDEYSGIYVPGEGSDTLSDISYEDRANRYIYDHVDEVSELNTDTNGWVLRGETEYDVDGITIVGGSERDKYGKLVSNFDVAANTASTYEYFDITGSYPDKFRYKEIRTYDTQDLIEAYWYFKNSNNRIEYKVDEVNDEALQYYDADGYKLKVKWAADGHTYGYASDGTTLEWEQYDDNDDGVIDRMKTFETGYDNFYDWSVDHWQYDQSWDKIGEAWVTIVPEDNYPTDPAIPQAPSISGNAYSMAQGDPQVTKASVTEEIEDEKNDTIENGEENREENVISGVSVEQILSKQSTMKKKKQQFNGYSPRMEVPEGFYIPPQKR